MREIVARDDDDVRAGFRALCHVRSRRLHSDGSFETCLFHYVFKCVKSSCIIEDILIVQYLSRFKSILFENSAKF